MTIRVREVRSVGDPAFGAAYRLLHRTFPRGELLPRSDWAEVLEERSLGLWTDIAWHLLVAERGRELVGAASGSYLGNVNAGMIGYIAVSPAARSGGLGVRLRRRLRATLERDAVRTGHRGMDGLIGEVKTDNPWLASLVRHEGAIALDFPYFQPSLNPRTAPVPLILYYQPLRRSRRALPAGEVRRLLYTMWRRVYREAHPLAQPTFVRMLRALAGRRRIGQRRRISRRP